MSARFKAAKAFVTCRLPEHIVEKPIIMKEVQLLTCAGQRIEPAGSPQRATWFLIALGRIGSRTLGAELRLFFPYMALLDFNQSSLIYISTADVF